MAMACLCHGVSERKIARAIDKGADTVEAVGEATRAGTCCQGCHPTIEVLLATRVTVRTSSRPAFA
jgi:NAD(P)H-nitrite reductase large subunit